MKIVKAPAMRRALMKGYPQSAPEGQLKMSYTFNL